MRCIKPRRPRHSWSDRKRCQPIRRAENPTRRAPTDQSPDHQSPDHRSPGGPMARGHSRQGLFDRARCLLGGPDQPWLLGTRPRGPRSAGPALPEAQAVLPSGPCIKRIASPAVKGSQNDLIGASATVATQAWPPDRPPNAFRGARQDMTVPYPWSHATGFTGAGSRSRYASAWLRSPIPIAMNWSHQTSLVPIAIRLIDRTSKPDVFVLDKLQMAITRFFSGCSPSPRPTSPPR